MAPERDLSWDGCLNVRDLGGHPTRDGGGTAFGAVVRADSVRQLSEAGWRALVEHGVRTVVDLRGDHERADDPPRELPVEVVHATLMENDANDGRALEPEVERIKQSADDGVSRTRDIYVLFLEHFRRNVAGSLRAVARAPEGGVVVHCVGGKDRTGLLTALLLHVAGVGTAEIAADYALTEERLRPREDAWLAAAETDAERDEIRRISRTPPQVIVALFEELERRYGSVEGYLRAAGVSEDELELVRARLRA
jgi:protein tyrosine/serine phosphatase